jgi:sulfur-oxidizing protein SoxY
MPEENAMRDDDHKPGATRRRFLADAVRLAGGLGVVSVVALEPARATPAKMQAAMKKVLGEAPLRKGKVTLDVPPLIENGNTVPLTVSVESPMTAADHVKAIHVLTQRNPLPDVVSVHLGPRAGRAGLSTRMRLADTQTVVAIAELSDGSFWSDSAEVVVTLSACLEEGLI